MSRITDTIRNMVQGAQQTIADAVQEPPAPKLRQVELVRKRIVGGQSSEIVRFRSWLSSIDGNAHAVEQLRGEAGELLIADITELILTHLGHVTEVTRMQDGSNGVASQARKASRGTL